MRSLLGIEQHGRYLRDGGFCGLILVTLTVTKPMGSGDVPLMPSVWVRCLLAKFVVATLLLCGFYGTTYAFNLPQPEGLLQQHLKQAPPGKLTLFPMSTPLSMQGALVTHILQDIENPQTLWIAAYSTYSQTSLGLYVSHNGGKSWSPSDRGLIRSRLKDLAITTLLQNRLQTKTLWAGTDSGLYMSPDGGQTWRAESVTSGSSRLDSKSDRSRGVTILSLLQDHQEPHHLWVGTDEGLYLKMTGKEHDPPGHSELTAVQKVYLENEKIFCILQDSEDTQILWVGTNSGIFMSQEGIDWQLSSWEDDRDDETKVYSLHQDLKDPFVLWAVTSNGIQLSRDRGKTWQSSNRGPAGTLDVFSLLQDRVNPNRLWAGTNAGLYISQDKAETWKLSSQGFDHGFSVVALQQDTQDPKILRAGTSHGIYISHDRGQHWQLSDQGALPVFSLSLLRDRQNPTWLWVGGLSGVYVSRNGGRSWNASDQLPWWTVVYHLHQDLETPEVLRAATFSSQKFDNTALLKRTDSGFEFYFWSPQSVIYMSSDGGTTWSQTMNNWGQDDYPLILLQDRQNPQVMWLGTGGGIYRTLNQGRVWQSMGDNLPDAIGFLLQHRKNSKTLWAGTEAGLYISHNQGESWERKTKGLPDNLEVVSITQAIQSHKGFYIGTDSGVFWSADQGENWQAATGEKGQLLENLFARPIIADAQNPQVLYALVFGEGFYRGIDKATQPSNMWIYLASLSLLSIGLLFIGVHYYRTSPARLEQQRRERYPVWAEQVQSSLYDINHADLSPFPKHHRDYIRQTFRKDHDALSLVAHATNLEVSERTRLDRFKTAWTQAENAIEANAIETFRPAADELATLFCESLAFQPLGDTATLGQLYGCLIDASNPAFQLNVRSDFPIIFMAKISYNDDDVQNGFGLLNRFNVLSDYFALMIAFGNAESLRQHVRNSAFKNDFIVLNRSQLWEILAAKSPVQRLIDSILEQIDLIAVSPYTSGGPTPEKMFFGRAEEEMTLLRNISRNNYALLANRQTGKTSLLNKVAPLLSRVPGNQVFHFTLQAVSEYGSFYDELALSDEFQAALHTIDNPTPSDFSKIVVNLKRQHGNRQMIFIFDEVDELLAYDLLHGERLFKIFRSLSEREHVHFIFSGTSTLVERVRHPSSPFFNFCETMNIGLLDEQSAKELVTEPLHMMRVTLEDEDTIVQRLLDITACHPNMIQYTCTQLVKRINDKQQRRLTRTDLDDVIHSSEFYDYFEQLLWGQATTLEMLIVYMMWPHSTFTKADVMTEATQRTLPLERVETSLETLVIYSILSRVQDSYTFTFKAFGKLMETQRDIAALAIAYQDEITRHDPIRIPGGAES